MFIIFSVVVGAHPAVFAQQPLADCAVYVGGGYSGDYATVGQLPIGTDFERNLIFRDIGSQMYGGAMKTWPVFSKFSAVVENRCNFINRYSRSGASAAEALTQLHQAIQERDLAPLQGQPAMRYFYILDPTTAREWLYRYPTDPDMAQVIDNWADTLRQIYDLAAAHGFSVILLDFPLWESLDLSFIAAILTGDPEQHTDEAWFDYAIGQFEHQFSDIPDLQRVKVWGRYQGNGNVPWVAFDGTHPPESVQKRAAKRIGDYLRRLLKRDF